MEKSNYYLVHGIFFVDEENFGIKQKPSIGLVEYAVSALFPAHFSGIIGPPYKGISGPLGGTFQDMFGPSDLLNIELTDERFEFEKRYHKSKDFISYTFKKVKDNRWVGTWEGPAYGTGFAHCIILPAPENFFSPYPPAELLGIKLT